MGANSEEENMAVAAAQPRLGAKWGGATDRVALVVTREEGAAGVDSMVGSRADLAIRLKVVVAAEGLELLGRVAGLHNRSVS